MQVMADNPALWTGPIGLCEPAATTKTLQRSFFAIGRRVTRKAWSLILHLP